MRLYLDEMYPPSLAALGRRYELDIVSSHEVGRNGASDEAQLRFAASENRCIVTEDVIDFQRQASLFLSRQEPHCGILLVPKALRMQPPRAVVESLIHMDRLYPDGLPPYAVVWLTPAPEAQ